MKTYLQTLFLVFLIEMKITLVSRDEKFPTSSLCLRIGCLKNSSWQGARNKIARFKARAEVCKAFYPPACFLGKSTKAERKERLQKKIAKMENVIEPYRFRKGNEIPIKWNVGQPKREPKAIFIFNGTVV